MGSKCFQQISSQFYLGLTHMCVKRPRHEGSDDLVPPGRMFSHVLGLVLSSPSSLRESFQPLDRQDVVIMVQFSSLQALSVDELQIFPEWAVAQGSLLVGGSSGLDRPQVRH